MAISVLPRELIPYVFECIPEVVTLSRCGRVCHVWQLWSGADYLWRPFFTDVNPPRNKTIKQYLDKVGSKGVPVASEEQTCIFVQNFLRSIKPGEQGICNITFPCRKRSSMKITIDLSRGKKSTVQKTILIMKRPKEKKFKGHGAFGVGQIGIYRRVNNFPTSLYVKISRIGQDAFDFHLERTLACHRRLLCIVPVVSGTIMAGLIVLLVMTHPGFKEMGLLKG